MLLGNSTIDIGLRITLQDQFTKPAAMIKNAVKGIRDEMQMYQDNLRAARNMYGGLAAAGAFAMSKLWQGFEKGAKFDYLVRGAAAASGATQEELGKLYTAANTMGSKLGFMPDKIAEAMRTLGLAGIDAKGILEAIKPVMYLSGGAMEDLAVSADIAISAMYQFGYQAKDMKYITDVLAQGSVKSNISLKDLGESLKYASSTAALLKQDLPTVTAMIMTLGNAGMKGSMAGVGLENMYRYLSLGLGEFKAKKRSDIWSSIGINSANMVDAKGDLKPMVEILHELRRAIGSFGTIDQGNILYQIFGVRGKRPPAVFLQELGLLEKNLRYTGAAGGVAESLYTQQMAGPYGAIIKLAAAIAETVNLFSSVMAPVLTPVLRTINWVLQGIKRFMESGFGKILVPMASILLTIKMVIWGVRSAMAALTLTMYNLRTSMAAMRTASNISMGSGLLGMMGIGTPGKEAGSYGRTATGTYYQRTATGATFLSTAAAARLGLAMAPGSRATMAASTWGARMGGLLTGRGLLAAVGGPVGAAILGISIALPLLAKAFSDNTSSTDQNTDAQKEASNMERLKLSLDANEFSGSIKRNYRYAGERPDEQQVLESRLKTFLQSPGQFPGRQFWDYSQPLVINLYDSDGQIKRTVRREVNNTLNQALSL